MSDYSINAEIPSNIKIICDQFVYIRGGLRFTFSFDCSPFHSFRIRVGYTPDPTITPEWDDLDEIANDVVEITSSTDLNYVVPIIQKYDWCMSDVSYGNIVVYMSSTACPDTDAIGPIYMTTYVSAAADFQFAYPKITSMPYIVVMGEEATTTTKPTTTVSTTTPKKSRRVLTDDGEYHTQGELQGELMEMQPERLPSATVNSLKNPVFKPLGFMGQGWRNHQVMPECVNSFKQLMNMTIPYNVITTNTPAGVTETGVKLVVNGLFVRPNKNDRTLQSFVHNYQQWVMSMFMFCRGGRKFTIWEDTSYDTVSSTKGKFVSAASSILALPPSQNFHGVFAYKIVEGATKHPRLDQAIPKESQRLVITRNQDTNNYEFIVPWATQYKCYNGNRYINLPRSEAEFLWYGLPGSTLIYAETGADDFIFGFPLPLVPQTNIQTILQRTQTVDLTKTDPISVKPVRAT